MSGMKIFRRYVLNQNFHQREKGEFEECFYKLCFLIFLSISHLTHYYGSFIVYGAKLRVQLTPYKPPYGTLYMTVSLSNLSFPIKVLVLCGVKQQWFPNKARSIILDHSTKGMNCKSHNSFLLFFIYILC